MVAFLNLLIPFIALALEKLITGGRQSRPGPDVYSMMRSHEQAMQRRETAFQEQQKQVSAQHEQQLQFLRSDMERREVTFREQHSTMNAQHEQQLQDMKDNNAKEQQRMESVLQKEQAQIRNQYEKRIHALAATMEQAEERLSKLQFELKKPVKDRRTKIEFVNALKLEIRQTESLLLVGEKGTGKSTFLWLLNRGEKPAPSFSDGTTEILQLKGFVDSIGLCGWTPEELAKLLVLMIYDGIPKDLIIFGNDRIDFPVTSLRLFGISNPMIVIMSSDFWRNYAPPPGKQKRINLVEHGDGVRKVQPVEDLELVYRLERYSDITDLGLGRPITHHDNIDELVKERNKVGMRVLSNTCWRNLGTCFLEKWSTTVLPKLFSASSTFTRKSTTKTS